MNKEKGKLGLKVSVRYALEVIHTGVYPASIVLSNLFFLQKSDTFPKHLEKEFFFTQKYSVSDQDKKSIVKIMDELKNPQIDKQKFLENILEAEWKDKKVIQTEIRKDSKNFQKNKPRGKNTTKNEILTPQIIVKNKKTSN